MCANLADPAPVGAACGCGPVATSAAGLSVGHLIDPTPAGVTHGCGPAAAGAAGLSVGHGPLRVTCDRGLAAIGAVGLSVGHRPLRAACGRGPAVATGLRWTCGPDSSAGGQRQEQAVKSRLGNLHLRLSPTE